MVNRTQKTNGPACHVVWMLVFYETNTQEKQNFPSSKGSMSGDAKVGSNESQEVANQACMPISRQGGTALL